LAALYAVNSRAVAQSLPGSLSYNGDWNGVNLLLNEQNTVPITSPLAGAVYDYFDVTAPLGWHVTAVYSANLFALQVTHITGANWEIRSGVSEGNVGTLIASGTTNSPGLTRLAEALLIKTNTSSKSEDSTFSCQCCHQANTIGSTSGPSETAPAAIAVAQRQRHPLHRYTMWQRPERIFHEYLL
jgi:hypothetical protein